MVPIEDCARAFGKIEEVELDTLSELVKAIRSLIKRQVQRRQTVLMNAQSPRI